MNIEKWPSIIRWILFLPAGIVCTAIAQGLIRLVNPVTPFIAEAIALAAEPWAFFVPSIILLPKYRKTFLIIFGILYCIMQIVSIYNYHYINGYSASPWAETVLSLLALSSCVSAVACLFIAIHEENLKEK